MSVVKDEEMVSRIDSPNTLGSQKTFPTSGSVVGVAHEVVAFFGPGVECKGEIWYEGTVQIDGHLEGMIHAQGTLVIGHRAVVKARIEAGTVVCQGNIQGDVCAKENIKLLSPGFIDGTLTTPRLSVETGGMFNGQVSMSGSPESKL
jgi:cytoskeletal protein CcmA (bactofilin family)